MPGKAARALKAWTPSQLLQLCKWWQRPRQSLVPRLFLLILRMGSNYVKSLPPLSVPSLRSPEVR